MTSVIRRKNYTSIEKKRKKREGWKKGGKNPWKKKGTEVIARSRGGQNDNDRQRNDNDRQRKDDDRQRNDDDRQSKDNDQH